MEEAAPEKKENVNQYTYQLTGYTDPIYVEAIFEDHYMNLLVTLVLLNRTKKTLQNVLVEMFIKEDVKVVEKPQMFNLAPGQAKIMKLVFRICSTEEGNLFGYITYSSASGNIPHIIPLEYVKINYLDNIQKEKASEKRFKRLWADLVWENKFQILSKLAWPYDFVMKIADKLNLQLVSPLTLFDKTSPLLVANLFGKSKFGEELLLNVSIEKGPDDKVKAACKIRAKSRYL